jgi:hypothetical protein
MANEIHSEVNASRLSAPAGLILGGVEVYSSGGEPDIACQYLNASRSAPQRDRWYDRCARLEFIGLINELQAVLPSDSWRGAETQPGIDSIRSYTYED